MTFHEQRLIRKRQKTRIVGEPVVVAQTYRVWVKLSCGHEKTVHLIGKSL